MLVLLACEIDNELFFGDKILHVESDFRKLGSVAVLRSLIRIGAYCVRVRRKYGKCREIRQLGLNYRLGKAAKFRSQYDIEGSNPVPASRL